MSEADVRELVSQLLLGKRLPEDVMAYIVLTTQGCPLWVRSLTQAMLVADLLYLGPDGEEYAPAGGSMKHFHVQNIPATLNMC